MTSEQLQELSKLITAQLNGPPWWSYLVLLAFGAGGAFFGAYLKRKGEAYAAHEDFKRVLEQQKQSTEAVEDIRQVLAAKGWRSQQQWSRRETHYLRLLHELFELDHWASTLANILQHEKYDSLKTRHVEAAQEFEAAKGGLRKELSTADLFVNEEALATVKGLLSQGRSFTDGIEDEEDGWGIYLGRWSKAAQKARVVVLRHAQDELNGID